MCDGAPALPRAFARYLISVSIALYACFLPARGTYSAISSKEVSVKIIDLSCLLAFAALGCAAQSESNTESSSESALTTVTGPLASIAAPWTGTFKIVACTSTVNGKDSPAGCLSRQNVPFTSFHVVDAGWRGGLDVELAPSAPSVESPGTHGPLPPAPNETDDPNCRLGMAIDFDALPQIPVTGPSGGANSNFYCYHVDGDTITTVSARRWKGNTCTAAGACTNTTVNMWRKDFTATRTPGGMNTRVEQTDFMEIPAIGGKWEGHWSQSLQGTR